MTLVIDIGNTNTVVALFEGENIKNEWRIFSDSRRTGDEYFSIIRSLFKEAIVNIKEIKSSALSSVVPDLIGPFIKAVQLLLGVKPLLLTSSIYEKLPIHIPISAIHSIGSDLVCNAMQAWKRFGSSCIVVDFGTALTFMALDNKANIMGTAISLGLGTALKALCNFTAQLPSVPLEAPPLYLGSSTVEAMQSGIVLGYKGLVESMVLNIKKEMSEKLNIKKEEIQVIATGGLNSVMEPLTRVFNAVDKYHTLKGLKAILDFTIQNNN